MAKRMTVKEKERVARILALLDKEYGTDYRCYLEHDSAWQLLIATMLSAQCTDARVNIVTKDLFVKYPSIEAFAKADREELEQDIRSTGFYRNKAKNIIACCQKLLLEFHGEVPSDLESLTSLAGVGRKTANVIRGNIFNEPSIVVDTHVKRISRKLGLTKEKKENLNIKKENIDAILKGMKGVTSEEGGTAYSTFANFNIELGGKTGSAQTDVQGKINGWFVGFAPYEEPEIAVVVLVENAGSGSYTAEVARDILQEYFGMNMEKVEEDLTAMPSTEIQN